MRFEIKLRLNAFLILACLILPGNFKAAHPLKMSVCDVKLNQETKQLTLKYKFFWDDLEAYLEKQTGRALNITLATAENHQLLATFINQHFYLKMNGVQVIPRLYKTSVQDVVLIVECLGDGFKQATTYDIDLTNRLLLDAYSDQYNLVRFDFWGNGNLETMRFEKSEHRLQRKIAE